MRIGLFTDQYYPIISGVVTSIKMLYEGLTDLGHECYIFTCMDEKMIEGVSEYQEKNIINFPGRPYPFKNIKDYRYTFFHKRFVKEIAKYDLDIIHVHTEYNIAKIAILASKKLHIPLVHTFHTLWEDYFRYLSPFFDNHFHDQMKKGLKLLYTGPIAKSATIEIVPTKKVLAGKKIYGLSKDIRVIPTGLDLEKFYSRNFDVSELNDLKQKLGINENDFVFTYVGRVSKEKNLATVLEAFSKIENTSAKLLIVGDGPDLIELKEKAKEYGVINRMIFTGLIPWENVPIYYQIGDVFVNASRSETQGLTYIESLASNLPLIVQIDECLTDIVLHGYNGLYFDGLEELIVRMNEVLNNPKLVNEMKKNTYSLIKRYTKKCYAKNVLDVYNDALNTYAKK